MRCDVKSWRKKKKLKRKSQTRGDTWRKKLIQRTTKDMTNSIEINTPINRLNQQCLLFTPLEYAASDWASERTNDCVYKLKRRCIQSTFISFIFKVGYWICFVLFLFCFPLSFLLNIHMSKIKSQQFRRKDFSWASDKKIESNDLIRLFIWNFELVKTIGKHTIHESCVHTSLSSASTFVTNDRTNDE